MRKTKLNLDFDYHVWESGQDDPKRADPAAIRRILFEIFLINDFEHAVLSLQTDGCVWGPAHTSVGQEAVAETSVHCP